MEVENLLKKQKEEREEEKERREKVPEVRISLQSPGVFKFDLNPDKKKTWCHF